FIDDNIRSIFDLFQLPYVVPEPWFNDFVVPVGVSFITFQSLSYTLDIYKGIIEPERKMGYFALFTCFWPVMVNGPIERAKNLLPQLKVPHHFEYNNVRDGLFRILWGLFKKVVIADNAATYANDIFNNYNDYSGSTLLLGAIFFAFQIYGDFSGYSDIAIGTSRLFGFKLMQNFAFPYFSRDIAEFWRRWHISLSTWFRDYLYIPLGGSRGGTWMKIRNTFIIFLVSGFWHGANWTFLAWGFLNALYFLPLLIMNKNRVNTNVVAEDTILPKAKELFQMGITFLLTTLAWIFFRSENISSALNYIAKLFSYSLLAKPTYTDFNQKLIFIIIIFLGIEWLGRKGKHVLEKIDVIPRLARYFIYSIIIFVIIVFSGEQQEFIYFQF
ncbi:MAG: MBOAT family protein, partial [Ignavibacteriae bacterium]|nr:MBOAT family protein [Ignavibacteriota bacterium]